MDIFEQEELTQMALSHNLTLAFSSESSIQAELSRESTADVMTIMVNEVNNKLHRINFYQQHIIYLSLIILGK